jgi:hypothetical protein
LQQPGLKGLLLSPEPSSSNYSGDTAAIAAAEIAAKSVAMPPSSANHGLAAAAVKSPAAAPAVISTGAAVATWISDMWWNMTG